MKPDNSLLYACVVDDIALIRERLKEAPEAQLSKRTREDGTPLHASALNGNFEAVDLLIEAGAPPEAGNFLQNNAMLACIEKGKLDMARHLIEKGSDIHRKGCQNRNALSQLICFAWDKDFARWLLDKGLDIQETARDKISLLRDAASVNNADAIDFLLENGIDRSAIPSALCWGIIHNKPDAVERLLQRGANLTEMYARCKGIEKSLYHRALTRVKAGQLIKLLLANGVDFTQVPARPLSLGVDKTKLSPLAYAKEQYEKWGNDYVKDNIETVESYLGGDRTNAD
jgi:ankyrin repeat protein